eukprot:Tbor_TRINITY_DN3742_c0_g1::TRINITY_DN3742_c0_g1_i1::g.2455::m.2455
MFTKRSHRSKKVKCNISLMLTLFAVLSTVVTLTIVLPVHNYRTPALLSNNFDVPDESTHLVPAPVEEGDRGSYNTARYTPVKHSLLPKSVYALLNDKHVMPKLLQYPTLESRLDSDWRPSGGERVIMPHTDETVDSNVSMDNSHKTHILNDSLCHIAELSKLKESRSNTQFLRLFTHIFEKEFGGLPWWLDEGGLIGAARDGSLQSTDDDFDFFAILPNQTAPCSPYSTNCSDTYAHGTHKGSETDDGNDNIDKGVHQEKREDGGIAYNRFIHKFLLVFWEKYNFCINKFNPDVNKFVSRGRLMYSFQLNRRSMNPKKKKNNNSPNCFVEGKPFAHMHLGMLVPNSPIGEIETNIWAGHTSHKRDRIPLSIVLPVSRCRVGALDGPCPNNVTAYLLMRNQAEYVSGKDGGCLLMRSKWSMARRRESLRRVRNLHACGYASLNPMSYLFESSGFTRC